jgi:hypothetical protein
MFYFPLLFQASLAKIGIKPKTGSPARILQEVFAVGVGLYLGIGTCCSIYPQFVPINVDQLEPEIRERAIAKGV